jgi:hypothetical protein
MAMVRTDVHARPAASPSALRLVLALLAGFLAVLIFHQLMLGLLHAAGLTAASPYNIRPVPPFGVPLVLSAAFWGGVWGIVFALADRYFPRGAGYWIAAILFGAIVLTLIAWFVVAPLKGTPVAAGFVPSSMAVGPLVNGAWGFGTALLLTLFERAVRF